MKGPLAEHRKTRRHERWLGRKAYRKYFGSQKPIRVFRSWSGLPDHCECGCGGVEYTRLDPTNWWHSLNPRLLWETKFLLPVLQSSGGLLWSISSIILARFLAIFSVKGFTTDVTTNPTGNALGAVFMPVRLLMWSIPYLLAFSLWIAIWPLGGSGVLLVYVALLTLAVAVMSLVWVLAVVFIASHGIVFLIGGTASILYLSNPAIGAVLIIAGVGIEYESRRRRDRHHREEMGRMLRIIEKRSGTHPLTNDEEG